MLNQGESIAIIVLIVAASVAFLWLLSRAWPTEMRRKHNDLIGWQISVLGTTYAVIVGFMLYAVWTAFQYAEVNAEVEANTLVSVARSAEGLPAGEREKIQNLASDYVNVMLTEEWPAMNRLTVSPKSHQIVEQLWTTVMNTQVHSTLEQIALDHTITDLRTMTDHRRTRDLEVNADLPGILWAILILGAIVTIVSACLFGGSDFRLQMAQVLMLSLLIASALVAIADINRPFQGSVHVSPAGFVRARATLDGLRSGK